jgi:hypothetical protein
VRRLFGVLVFLLAGGACGGTVLLGSPTDGGTEQTSPCVAGGGSCIGPNVSCTSTEPELSCGTTGEACCGAHPTTWTDDASGADDTSGGTGAEDDSLTHGDDAGGDDTGGDATSQAADAGVCGDAGPVPFDAPVTDASASAIASFELIIGGVVRQPMSCPEANWEYQGTVGQRQPDVYIRNTGGVPIAYTASATWFLPGMYQPGAPTGISAELNGVLPPGEVVNSTCAFQGGYVALLGASKPFSSPDAFAPHDEGTIPWPSGVGGSGGATTMYVAEIQVLPNCDPVNVIW